MVDWSKAVDDNGSDDAPADDATVTDGKTVESSAVPTREEPSEGARTAESVLLQPDAPVTAAAPVGEIPQRGGAAPMPVTAVSTMAPEGLQSPPPDDDPTTLDMRRPSMVSDVSARDASIRSESARPTEVLSSFRQNTDPMGTPISEIQKAMAERKRESSAPAVPAAVPSAIPTPALAPPAATRDTPDDDTVVSRPDRDTLAGPTEPAGTAASATDDSNAVIDDVLTDPPTESASGPAVASPDRIEAGFDPVSLERALPLPETPVAVADAATVRATASAQVSLADGAAAGEAELKQPAALPLVADDDDTALHAGAASVVAAGAGAVPRPFEPSPPAVAGAAATALVQQDDNDETEVRSGDGGSLGADDHETVMLRPGASAVASDDDETALRSPPAGVDDDETAIQKSTESAREVEGGDGGGPSGAEDEVEPAAFSSPALEVAVAPIGEVTGEAPSEAMVGPKLDVTDEAEAFFGQTEAYPSDEQTEQLRGRGANPLDDGAPPWSTGEFATLTQASRRKAMYGAAAIAVVLLLGIGLLALDEDDALPPADPVPEAAVTLPVAPADGATEKTPQAAEQPPVREAKRGPPPSPRTRPEDDEPDVRTFVVPDKPAGAKEAPTARRTPPPSPVPATATTNKKSPPSKPTAVAPAKSSKTRSVKVVAPKRIRWSTPTGKRLGSGSGTLAVPRNEEKIVAHDSVSQVRTFIPTANGNIRYADLAKGTLDIRAFPYATVWAGKRKLGDAPFAPIKVVEGQYRLRFVFQDKIEKRTVKVKAGRTTRVAVKFIPGG